MKIKQKPKAGNKDMYKKREKETEEEIVMLDTIEEELEEQGISLFDNENVDEEYLRLPADITDTSSKELGKYFNAFTQQKMWTRTVVGRLSATVREKRRSLDDIKADVFSSHPAKMPVKEKELRFQTDARAREVLDDLFMYEEKLNMVQDYLENLVDALILVSREITRRGQDMELNAREDNIANKRGGKRRG